MHKTYNRTTTYETNNQTQHYVLDSIIIGNAFIEWVCGDEFTSSGMHHHH